MYRTLCIIILFAIGITTIVAQDQPSDEQIKQIVLEISEPTVVSTTPNNDGIHAAIVTEYPCVPVENTDTSYAIDILSIENSESGEILWQTEQLISCGGLGTYGFGNVRWIENVLYYDGGREGSVHGASLGFVEPLYRYDFGTGADDVQSLGFALLSYSLDGVYVVMWNNESISIRDAVTFEGETVTLDNTDMIVANVLWLPDQSGLLVIQANDFMMPTSSIVTFINREDLSKTVLLDNTE